MADLIKQLADNLQADINQKIRTLDAIKASQKPPQLNLVAPPKQKKPKDPSKPKQKKPKDPSKPKKHKSAKKVAKKAAKKATKKK